jgi:hypothetical protein
VPLHPTEVQVVRAADPAIVEQRYIAIDGENFAIRLRMNRPSPAVRYGARIYIDQGTKDFEGMQWSHDIWFGDDQETFVCFGPPSEVEDGKMDTKPYKFNKPNVIQVHDLAEADSTSHNSVAAAEPARKRARKASCSAQPESALHVSREEREERAERLG